MFIQILLLLHLQPKMQNLSDTASVCTNVLMDWITKGDEKKSKPRIQRIVVYASANEDVLSFGGDEEKLSDVT